MTSVAQALRDAAERLALASDTARLDAELLMAEALGVGRSDMLLRHMQGETPAAFEALIERRGQHEPVAYILGRKEFYGLDLEVSSAVLIPRADSETLIEAAREALADRAPRRILDLGTGSGALLLAAMTVWPKAAGTGLERDPGALQIAMANAERVGVNLPPQPVTIAPSDGEDEVQATYSGRARFRLRDWRHPNWSDELGQYDLILANPPYIEDDAQLGRDVREWEPAGALFAGPEGLDDYRILIRQLSALLAENGVAVFEIGSTQAEAVTAIATEAGFTAALRCDLGGRPRVLVLRRIGD